MMTSLRIASLTCLGACGLLFLSSGLAGAEVLYSVSPRDGFLRTLDPASGVTLTQVAISMPPEKVSGCTGLAAHPATGELWAVLKAGSSRLLAVIDPGTGLGREVGELQASFAALAFDGGGTLYGVVGDGDPSDGETLFTIDTSTAAATRLFHLGRGDDGEALAFHARQDRLFHASGTMDVIFESIDLKMQTTSDIPVPGSLTGSEVTALAFAGPGVGFLWAGIGGEKTDVPFLFRITAGGNATFIGYLDHVAKGLALVETPEGRNFVRGDSNADGRLDISDPIHILSYLFASGSPPPCGQAADADDSGSLDITDAVSLLGFLFQGGTAPAAPYPACGVDPSANGLTCDAFAGCP